MTDVLILSVGGSPQPLRSAIERRSWDRVLFIVSDGANGSPSSRGQVEEPEISYGRGPDGVDIRGPGLRHLPGGPCNVAISAVPADDLDRALALVDAALAAEIAAGHSVTVDYTGGTKTMTAAMVLAASAQEGATIQFMAGRRSDLRQVEAGTEQPVEMPGHLLGLANLFGTARAFTSRRTYQSALQTILEVDRLISDVRKRKLATPPGSWAKRVEGWRGYLAVLDLWDRFDHSEAHRRLSQALDMGDGWAEALQRSGDADRLAALAAEKGATAQVCEDLWLNALRRADLGLYDDAVARLYRLAEAVVQARLRTGFGIDTGRIPPARLPDWMEARETARRDPRTGEAYVELGLYRSLELLEHLSPADPIVQEWPRRDNGAFDTPDWQGQRNRSILAHGFRPLGHDDWKRAKHWFDARRKAFWEDALGRSTAQQLPHTLP